MKKFLLSVFSCVTVATLSFAQGFTPQMGDTSKAVIMGEDLHVYNNIINNAATSGTYDWHVTGSNFPSGWDFGGMCDNANCYTTTGTTVNTTNPVNAGDTMTHYVIFTEDGSALVPSFAWVRSSIQQTGSPSTATPLTFIAEKNTSSSTITITKSTDNIVVFPNPAKSSVNVIYDANMNVKNIGIYNLIGKMVSVYKVGSTSAKLDVEELPSGIYFIRLFNSQGKTVGTRKFTHQ